jgi:dTDP-4-amino-4,6-dideoxygalactose transaminase
MPEAMPEAMTVPFFDIGPTHAAIEAGLQAAWSDTLRRGHFIMGPALQDFEAAFARYCGSETAIGVANGLDALTLTLEALGIGAGDEVIVPAHTFIATWLAVTRAQAHPVPVDCDAATCNIDPAKVAAAITPRTRAIIAVHLYGNPADMAPLQALAAQHGLHLVEDAAQAHGATYRGRKTGSLGIAAGFSFYPTKNLGALGDGGAVVTGDAGVAERLRLLRNYGSARKYEHQLAGCNSRLDELQAAILAVKLPQLDELNRQRRAIAQAYTDGLRNLPGVTLPAVTAGSEPVWHLYTIRHPRRDAMIAALAKAGVQALIHYPAPPHLQPAYAAMGRGPGSFPVAEAIAGTTISLPIWPGMAGVQIAQVIDAVRRAAMAEA